MQIAMRCSATVGNDVFLEQNSSAFSCALEIGHEGRHSSSGKTDNKVDGQEMPFKIYWEGSDSHSQAIGFEWEMQEVGGEKELVGVLRTIN